jgi:hypothetical protein
MSALIGNERRLRTCGKSPHSALHVEMCMAQHLSLSADALNRFAIGALVVGVVLNRDFLRVLWCRVCAVCRGNFASIDRGYSDEHSTIDTNDVPSGPHAHGHVRAQSRPCIPEQPPACLYPQSPDVSTCSSVLGGAGAWPQSPEPSCHRATLQAPQQL